MNSIAEEFNRKAGNYESNRLSGWYIAHAEILLKIVPQPESGFILDIGCGTGYFLRRFLKINPKLKGIGIDVSTEMIRQASKYALLENISNVDFICADWEKMEPGSIHLPKADIVICANAFHYFSCPIESLVKIVDIMDSGFFYIVERNKSSSFLTYLWDILHRHLIKDNVVFYDQEKLQKAINDAGFNDVKVLHKIKRYFWKGKWYTNIIIVRGRCGNTPRIGALNSQASN